MVKKVKQYHAPSGKRVIQGSDDTFGMVADDLGNAVPTDETPIGVDNQAGTVSPGSANPTVFHKPTCPPPPPPRKKRIFRRGGKAEVKRLFFDSSQDLYFTDDYEFPIPSNPIGSNTQSIRFLVAVQEWSWYYLDPDDGSAFVVNVAASFGGAAVMFATESSQSELEFISEQDLLQAFGGGTAEFKLGWGMQGDKIILALLPRDYYGDGNIGGTTQTVTHTGSTEPFPGGGAGISSSPGGGPKLECYSLFNPVIGFSVTNADATGETDDERLVTYPDGTKYEFHRINRVTNQNVTSSNTPSGVGIFFFCFAGNMYAQSGSYGYNGTYLLEDCEEQTGTTRAIVLEIDEDDNYTRTDYTGSYSVDDVSPRRTETFAHNGSYSSNAVFGTGFPSCPPTVQIGALLDSTSQTTSASLLIEDELTSTYAPITIPLKIDPDSNTVDFRRVIPNTSDSLDYTYSQSIGNISPTNPYDVCTSLVIGGFFGGDNYNTLNSPISPTSIWSGKNRPFSEPTNALGNGNYSPYTAIREYPFVSVVVNGTPLWFDIKENYTTTGAVTLTTPTVWGFVIQNDVSRSVIGNTGGPTTLPMTPGNAIFNTIQGFPPYNTSSENRQGWRLGWRTLNWQTKRPGAGYPVGIFSMAGGPNDRDTELATGTRGYTSTSDEEIKFKFGNTEIDYLDSLFIAPLRDDWITVNVTASTITITRIINRRSLLLFSTRGLEGYYLNPEQTIEFVSTAPNISSSTNLLTSFTENEAVVTPKLTDQDWWVCIRDEGASFPDTLTYTLYDCTLSSFSIVDRSTGTFNSLPIYASTNTDNGNVAIQFDSLTFTINSEQTVDHFPIPQPGEAVTKEVLNFGSTADQNIIVTTKNMLALALQLRRFLTIDGGTWYLTNRQADNLESDTVSGEEGGDMFGTKLDFNQTTTALEFDSNFCYRVPKVYTEDDDDTKLLSKKLDLKGFKP